MRIGTLFLCLGLLGAVGCYGHESAAPTSASQLGHLEKALAAGRSGQLTPQTVDGWFVQPIPGGGTRVTRGEQWNPRIPVQGVSDAWITAKVKSTFAADSDVKAAEINVNTDENGLVSLRGHVDSPFMAGKAVEDALRVQGVNAVDSYLTF